MNANVNFLNVFSGKEPNAREQKLNDLLDQIQEDIESAKMPYNQILSYQRRKLEENGFKDEANELKARHKAFLAKGFNDEKEKIFHDSLYEARIAAGLEVENNNENE